MSKSRLCEADVDFLMVLVENKRYLTYPQMVNIYLAKINEFDSVHDRKKEFDRVYVNFRKAKSRIKKKAKNHKRKYFLEDSKMLKIHPEAVEKPRTCVILLEIILALQDGLNEVRLGRFEQFVSAKYKDSKEGAEWSEVFVRQRLEDARDSGYLTFDEAKQEIVGESRLTTDEKLIIRIVEGFRDRPEQGVRLRTKLEELLKNFN